MLGKVEERYCLASESSGLDIIGARLIREIEPGEICWIDEDGYHIEQVVDRKREALCVFEFIYFARPDSVMKGQTLYAARSRMGEELAARIAGGGRPGDPRARHRATRPPSATRPGAASSTARR